MKQDEKYSGFEMEDKSVPKPFSSSELKPNSVLDLSRYDEGYMMRLYRRGFVPVQLVAPLAGCN
ncbi:MAG TPA: hypothetical protein VF369_06400 [candidate division Zixibacteria bacterium]